MRSHCIQFSGSTCPSRRFCFMRNFRYLFGSSHDGVFPESKPGMYSFNWISAKIEVWGSLCLHSSPDLTKIVSTLSTGIYLETGSILGLNYCFKFALIARLPTVTCRGTNEICIPGIHHSRAGQCNLKLRKCLKHSCY